MEKWQFTGKKTTLQVTSKEPVTLKTLELYKLYHFMPPDILCFLFHPRKRLFTVIGVYVCTCLMKSAIAFHLCSLNYIYSRSSGLMHLGRGLKTRLTTFVCIFGLFSLAYCGHEVHENKGIY